MKTIAIIGTGGTNARLWIEAFLAKGWRVRNLVRDPGKTVKRPHLTAVAFDFTDQRSHEPALADADALALISPATPDQVAQDSALIAAARRGGVGGVIHLSVIGADMRQPISFFARNAAKVEAALRAANIPHIIMRPNGYMQNLLRQKPSIEAGSFIEPSGAVATSRVDVSDLADVAAAIADGPFDGRVLTLTGPAALSGDEMAATLSEAMGRPVRYISPSLAEFRAALNARGLPAWQVDAFVEVQEAMLSGHAPHLARVTGDIEAVTGHPSRSFAEFARREFGSSTLRASD
jgi:uncharacterized protein YbjT (DUF2867 family)